MLLLTNPDISAPTNAPALFILAIHDLSDTVNDFGSSGSRIPLKDNVEPR